MSKSCRILALGLSLLIGLGILPAGAGMLSVEQLQADVELLVDAEIHQRPMADSPQIGILLSGSQVRVTGRITGTEWFRISTQETPIGYVRQDVLNPKDSEALGLVRSPREVQVAAVQTTVVPGEAFTDCDGCPRMITLPPGSFIMGSNEGDIAERPERHVTLAKVFAIGKYEVSVAEWMLCVNDGGCSFSPKAVARPEMTPVRNISWQDAQQYVQWLSTKTGKPYRLPSEAEWEYAARAGSQSGYWWGGQPEPGKADCKDCGSEWSRKRPAGMGRFEANPFGLHDMNGGVAEWTADCWFRTYKNAPKDGTPRIEDGCEERVLRGGSWRDTADAIKATSRQGSEENLPYVVNGFRIARSPE
ncbi:MAG: SUMF1/EgtB/PvdO family nonheme iron enzyme [Kiloniellales bacterium]|nr:SUMF1/EgtB/PvdO family nonheme iron enzyme [Kiloniellales bacterium]